jgi:hypothetical protein
MDCQTRKWKQEALGFGENWERKPHEKMVKARLQSSNVESEETWAGLVAQ